MEEGVVRKKAAKRRDLSQTHSSLLRDRLLSSLAQRRESLALALISPNGPCDSRRRAGMSLGAESSVVTRAALWIESHVCLSWSIYAGGGRGLLLGYDRPAQLRPRYRRTFTALSV